MLVACVRNDLLFSASLPFPILRFLLPNDFVSLACLLCLLQFSCKFQLEFLKVLDLVECNQRICKQNNRASLVGPLWGLNVYFYKRIWCKRAYLRAPPFFPHPYPMVTKAQFCLFPLPVAISRIFALCSSKVITSRSMSAKDNFRFRHFPPIFLEKSFY